MEKTENQIDKKKILLTIPREIIVMANINALIFGVLFIILLRYSLFLEADSFTFFKRIINPLLPLIIFILSLLIRKGNRFAIYILGYDFIVMSILFFMRYIQYYIKQANRGYSTQISPIIVGILLLFLGFFFSLWKIIFKKRLLQD
jgi:hypothetical protein